MEKIVAACTSLDCWYLASDYPDLEQAPGAELLSIAASWQTLPKEQEELLKPLLTSGSLRMYLISIKLSLVFVLYRWQVSLIWQKTVETILAD
jgi:hypothetical protein